MDSSIQCIRLTKVVCRGKRVKLLRVTITVQIPWCVTFFANCVDNISSIFCTFWAFIFLIFNKNTLFVLIISYINDQQSIKIIINERICIHAIHGKVTRHENCTVELTLWKSFQLVSNQDETFQVVQITKCWRQTCQFVGSQV